MKVATKTPENRKRIVGGNHTLFPAELHVDNTLNHSHQVATVEYCERLSRNSWTPVRRTVALDEAVLLGFQSRDEDWGMKIFRKVAGGDADIPTPRAPFGEFVIRERARGNGVDGLPAILTGVRPKLEDQSLASTGGRLNDDILAFTQRGDRLLLPKVRHGDLIECGKICELFGERRHKKNIAEI
jgi:hypothetical protein